MVIRHPTILYVDDVRDHGGVHETALSSQGVTVVSTPTNGSAVAAFVRASSPPDVAILDLASPEMSAFDAYLAMQETHPALRVLFVSGGVEDCLGVITGLSNLPSGTHWRFLAKPFTQQQLARCIGQLLGEKQDAAEGARL
jgi:DNA-binding NtrC family response regulator